MNTSKEFLERIGNSPIERIENTLSIIENKGIIPYHYQGLRDCHRTLWLKEYYLENNIEKARYHLNICSCITFHLKKSSLMWTWPNIDFAPLLFSRNKNALGKFLNLEFQDLTKNEFPHKKGKPIVSPSVFINFILSGKTRQAEAEINRIKKRINEDKYFYSKESRSDADVKFMEGCLLKNSDLIDESIKILTSEKFINIAVKIVHLLLI